MTKWDEMRKEYAATNATLGQLAEKYGVPLGTIKSQKSRDAKNGIEWTRGSSEKDATKTKKVATKTGKVATKNTKVAEAKKGAIKGKKNKGNPNPSNQFAKRNAAAVKHGLFAKYLHLEQSELLDDIEEMDIAEAIWLQIKISFAAIIRAQKIMWVEDAGDHLDNFSGTSSSTDGESETRKVVYAHERYEAYIRAQTRATAEYRNLVKQFLELTTQDDERRLKLKQMQLNIKKTKAEIADMQGSGEEEGVSHIVVSRKESRDVKEADE